MIYKYLEEDICSMCGVYSEDSFSLKKLNGYRKRKPISRRSTSFLHTQHIPEHDNILPIDEGAFSCYGGRMQKNIDYTCPYSDCEWYQAAQTASGNIFLPPHTEQLVLNPQYDVVSVVKPFRSITDSSKTLGVIKVDLLYSAIEQSARIIDTGNRGGLLIINQQNQIIYLKFDSYLPWYMAYPRFLLEVNISETAKLVYMLLLDRARVSMKNDTWQDKHGRVFVLYESRSPGG